VGLAAVDRPASIILVTDATYYGVAPDVYNMSGLVDTNKYSAAQLTALQGFLDTQGSQYKNYWGNISNGLWSYVAGGAPNPMDAATIANVLSQGPGRHQAKVNCQFADGHVKALDYKFVITDFCSWSTGADGAGLQCN
jgi:prepilin-type processing-associated H-X9-DG protein